MSDIDEEKNKQHAGYNYMTILRLKKIEDPEIAIDYVQILPLLAAKDTPLPKTKATLALLRSWTDLYTTVVNNINEFVKTSFSDDGIIPSKQDIIENIIVPLDPTGTNGYLEILSSILDDIYKESVSIYAKPTIQKRVEEIAKEALPEEEKVQYKVQDEPEFPEADDLTQHVINRIRIVRRYLQTHPYAFVASEYIKKVRSMLEPKFKKEEEFNLYLYSLLEPFQKKSSLIKEELNNLNVKKDNILFDERIYSILEKENDQFNKEIISYYTTLLLVENDILVKLAPLNDVFIREEDDDQQESILNYVTRVRNELPEISPIIDSYLILLQYIGELKNTFIVEKDRLEGNGSGVTVAERAIAKLNAELEEFMALPPEERQAKLDANEKRKKNREQKKKTERKEELQEKLYIMYIRSQIAKVLENIKYNTHEEYKQLLELAHQDVEDEIEALSQEELDQVLEEFKAGLKPGELPSISEGKPEEVAKVKSEAEKERLYRKQQLIEQRGLALPRDQVNLPYYALLAYYDNNPLIVVEDPSLTILYSNFPNINTQFKNEFLSLSPQDRLRFIRRLDKYSNMEEKTQSFKTFNQVYNTGQSLQFYVFDFLHSFVIENKPGNGCDVLKTNLEDELVDIQSNLSRWIEVYGENVRDRLMLYLANKYKCEESDVRNTYVVKRKNKRREEQKEEEKKEEEKDDFSWKSIYERIGEIVNEGLEGQLEILEKLTTEYPSLVPIEIFKELIAKLMELVQQKEERVRRKQDLKLNVDPLIEKVIKERRLSPLDFLSVNEDDQEKDVLQRSLKSRLLSLRAFFDSEDNRTALFNIIEIIKRTKRLDIKDPQKSEAVIKKILEITQPGAIRDFLLNFISLYGSLASLPTFKQRLGLFEFAHLYQLPAQAQKEVSDRIASTYLTSLERTRPVSLINITNTSIISQIEYLYLTKSKNKIDEEYIQHLLNQLTFENPELKRREGEKWVQIAQELKRDLEENLRSRQKKDVVATIDRMKDILRAGRGEPQHLLRDPFKGSSLFRERRFSRRDPIQKTLDNLPPMNPLMKQLLLSHLTRPWGNGERMDYWISSPTGVPKENWSPEHQRYAGVRIGFKNQYRVTTLFWNWFLQTFFEDQLCKTEDLLNTFTPGPNQKFILGIVTPNMSSIEFTREVIHSIIREGLLSSLMVELKRRIPDLDVDKHSDAIRKIAKEEEKEIIDRRLSELTNVKEVILLQEQPFFPKIDDESKYRFTNVSLYSSPSYLQSLYTANIIASYFKDQYYKDVVITDATSCIGGDTWAFAEKFGHVNAIEMNPLHFDILNNNMQQLELNNISYYNENFLSFIPRIKQSLIKPEQGKGYPKKPQVIFIDAPWGGEDYKTNTKVGLYSNDGEFIEISTLIKMIGDTFEEVEKEPTVLSSSLPKYKEGLSREALDANARKGNLGSLVDKEYKRSPGVLLAIKVPFTYDLSKLSHRWFPSKEVFEFKTSSGHVLYKLVTLYNFSGGRTFQVVNPKTNQYIENINKEAPTFSRIGYKYMKYKEVAPIPVSIKLKPSMQVLTREDILKECNWLSANKNETKILSMLNVPTRQEGKIGNKTIAEHCKEAVYGFVEQQLMNFYTKHKEVLRYDQLSIRVKEFIGIALQRSSTVGDFFSRILRVLFVLENPYAMAIQQTFLKSSPKWWSYLFGYDLSMLFPEMLAYPSEVQQHLRQLFEQYIYTSSYNFSIYLYNQAYKYPKEEIQIDDKKRYDLYSELVTLLNKERDFYKPVCDNESDLYYIKDGKVECLPILSLADHDTELKIPEAIMRDIKSRLHEVVGGMTVNQISSAKDAETRQIGIDQFEDILNSVNKRNELAEEISNKYPSIYYEEKEPIYHPVTTAIIDWIVINKEKAEEKRKKSIASNLHIIAKAHASSLVRNLVDYFAEQHKDLLTSIILSSKRKGRKLLLDTLEQQGFWTLFNELFKLDEEVKSIYKEQALEDFVYYITGDTIGHVLQEVVEADPSLLKTKCMECHAHLEDQGISSVIMNNGSPLPVSFCSTMCAERFTASYPDQEEMEEAVREQQQEEEEEHKKQIATTLLTGYPNEGRIQDGIFIPSIRNLVIIGDMLRRWVLKVKPELKSSDLEEIYWAIVTSDYYKDVVKAVQSSLFENQKQSIESLSSRLPGCEHVSKIDAENRLSTLVNTNWNKIKALLDKDIDKKDQLNFLEDIIKPILNQTGCTGSNENDVRDIQLIALIEQVGNKIDRALLLGDKSNIVNNLKHVYGLEYEDLIFRRKPYLGRQELIRDVKTMLEEHPPYKDILKITNFLSNISTSYNETKSLQLLIKLLIGGDKQENEVIDFSNLNLVTFRQFLELSNWIYEGEGDNEKGVYKLFKFIQKYKGLVFEFTSKLKEYLAQNGWTVQQKLVFKGKEPLDITRDFLSRVAQYGYTQSGSGGSALRKMIIKLQLGGILDEVRFRYNQSLTLYKELATLFIKVCSSEIQKENVRHFDLEQMLAMVSKSEKENKKKTKRVFYTEEQCKQWILNPEIHPITGKDLQTSLEMGYSIDSLQKQCEKYKTVVQAQPVLGVGRKARVFGKPAAKPSQVEQPVDMFRPPKEEEEEKEFEKEEIDLESLDQLLQVLKSMIDQQLSSYLETDPGFFLPRRPLSSAFVVKYNLINVKIEDRSEERLSSVILKWDHDRNVEFTVSSTGMTLNEINEPKIYLPIGVKVNIEYTYLRKDGTPVRPIWLGVDEISLYNMQRGGSGDMAKIPQLREQEGELIEDVESIDQQEEVDVVEPEAEYYPEDNEGDEEQEQDYGGEENYQVEEEGF